MLSSPVSDQAAQRPRSGLVRQLFTRINLILLAGLLIIFVVLAATRLTIRTAASDQNALSDRDIGLMLEKDTERVNIFVSSTEKIPVDLANILDLQRLGSEEIKIVLNSIMLNKPEIYGASVTFVPGLSQKKHPPQFTYAYRKEGQVRFSVSDIPGYEYSHKDWYLLPKIMGRPVWVDPYFDEGLGNVFMTTCAAPFSFFDGVSGTFSGVVTVDVSIDWLTGIFQRKKLPNNGFVMMLSEDGTVISAPRKAWVVHETLFSLAEELKQPELRRIGRHIQRGETGVSSLTSARTGERVKIFYARVSSNHWGMLYLIPEKAGGRPFGDGGW